MNNRAVFSDAVKESLSQLRPARFVSAADIRARREAAAGNWYRQETVASSGESPFSEANRKLEG